MWWVVHMVCGCVFFFKQKTAYELRISDWSSDVCSSDLEAQTILSYLRLRVGQQYDRAVLDQALKDLAATELFKDFQITDNNGALTIQVAENPVINRVILEGNKRLKEDKIRTEIKMAPHQIYTRSKVRADVEPIIELYQRKGRCAATVA